MPLSSNTLIHFTKSKEDLMGILSNNFKLFYCKETIILDEKENTFHVPMVSFCDIPLSEVKDHISKYGNYGIGLTKDWGKRNGLNPVLYVAQKSKISINIGKVINYHARKIAGANLNEVGEEIRSAFDIVRYMKNYEGTLKRATQEVESYRFSDEREWRFVPEFSEDYEMFILSKDYPAKKEKANLNVGKIRLEFEPNDIRYIIINEDVEISEFINHLRYSKGSKYSLSDIEKLTTRILTAEQIKTDL
jgi:hypothetical protein